MSNVRVLPLEGSCNFRDCGGYETIDGARVRWGGCGHQVVGAAGAVHLVRLRDGAADNPE